MEANIDCFLRLSIDAVLSAPLGHLFSGIDETAMSSEACGGQTSISGYTEWIGADDKPISLGWDWMLMVQLDASSLVRVGDPRTNVLLVDAQYGGELSWSRSVEALSTVVDALPWREQVQCAIETLHS